MGARASMTLFPEHRARSRLSLPVLLCASVIAAIDVGGTSTCPTPDEVNARISEFSPQTLDSGPELSATLTQAENGVRIELRDAEGSLIAQKLLAGTGECSKVAEADIAAMMSFKSAE